MGSTKSKTTTTTQPEDQVISTKSLRHLHGLLIFTVLIALVAAALLIYLSVTSYQLNNALADSEADTDVKPPKPQNHYYGVGASGIAFGIALVVFILITAGFSARKKLQKKVAVQTSTSTMGQPPSGQYTSSTLPSQYTGQSQITYPGQVSFPVNPPPTSL